VFVFLLKNFNNLQECLNYITCLLDA